ncbi:alpha/beta fold hydrolase [Robertkochia aurantiaca]|uniref:alpha/beta fold hydrolase n=1 Tax=Robertkochia aurantiaca TaxID=2873700 RepID=UPI001CCF94EC|nr:alpha/beta hydrolase [Robertkochia sp. 3YJGBD-33]
MKKLSLKGRDLDIAYFDQNPDKEQVILLIHGLGSNAKAYKKMMPNFPDSYRVIAPDLPGYGSSEQGDVEPGMRSFAGIIDSFINQLQLRNVTLVGHSMGGQIAMTLAVSDLPQEIERLVLIAPAGIEQFDEKERQWFYNTATAENMKMLSDEQILNNFNVNFYGARIPEDAAFMYKDRLAIKNDTAAYDAYLELTEGSIRAMLQEPVYDKIGDIEIPVLVLYGKEDLLIPNRFLHANLTQDVMLKKLQEDYPSVEIKTAERAGHFLPWDRPEWTAGQIIDFMEPNN